MHEDAIWSAGDFVRYWIESDDGDRRRAWTLELALPAVPEPAGSRDPGYADPVSGFRRMQNASPQSLTDQVSNTRLMRYVEGQVEVRLRLERYGVDDAFTTTVPTQVQAHVWQERVDTKPEFGIEFLFHVLLRVDHLLEELVSVVRPPSITSVIGRGMTVFVDLRLHRPEKLEVIEVDTPLGRLPAFWLPATLFANDQRALDCRLLITWRRSPLLLTMGLLRIEGHHPDDANKQLSVHLIAARRGRPVQSVDRDDLGDPGLRRGMSERELVAAVQGEVERRYRLRGADGRVVDLVSMELPNGTGSRVGAFVGGDLQFFNSGGRVAQYLRHRGIPGPHYKKEYLVPTDLGRK